MTPDEDWSTPRVLKRAVDFRCAADTNLGPFRTTCGKYATDVIDNTDGSSTPVCPEHGGRK